MKKRRTNGFSWRDIPGTDFGACLPLPSSPKEQLRSADGSAEKVERDVESVFVGLSGVRINRKTRALHPDDEATITTGLEKLGHTVRVSRNQFFVDTHFRLNFDGATVHLTDLRTCN